MNAGLFRICICMLVTSVSISCDGPLQTDRQLSQKEKRFIQELGLLDDNEPIILFDSQAGGLNPVKTSGNFFTEKRIASYWIDTRNPERSHIEYALYQDIDTIRRFPKFKSLTLASYLEVQRKNGTTFKVYVSADSVNTWKFFNRAMECWNTYLPGH